MLIITTMIEITIPAIAPADSDVSSLVVVTVLVDAIAVVVTVLVSVIAVVVILAVTVVVVVGTVVVICIESK